MRSGHSPNLYISATRGELHAKLDEISGISTQELQLFENAENEDEEEFVDALEVLVDNVFPDIADTESVKDLALEYARIKAQEAWFIEKVKDDDLKVSKEKYIRGYHLQLKKHWTETASIVCGDIEVDEFIDITDDIITTRACEVFGMVRDTAKVTLNIELPLSSSLLSGVSEDDTTYEDYESTHDDSMDEIGCSDASDANSESAEKVIEHIKNINTHTNPVLDLARIALLERWASDESLQFDLTRAAESTYGVVIIEPGYRRSKKAPVDQFREFINGTIGNYEEMLRNGECNGDVNDINDVLPLPLTDMLQMDQILTEVELREQYNIDAQWLIRIIDDVYSEHSGLRLADMSRDDIDEYYTDRFGRSPAETIIMNNYTVGHSLELHTKALVEEVAHFFPPAMTPLDLTEYLENRLKIACVNAMQEWDENWDREPEGVANCSRMDADTTEGFENTIHAMSAEYRLDCNNKLQDAIARYLNEYTVEIYRMLKRANSMPIGESGDY